MSGLGFSLVKPACMLTSVFARKKGLRSYGEAPELEKGEMK